MAAFICRMCGGILEHTKSGVCRCNYCGTMQSVPMIDDEDKAQLCTVAERFRKEYQYDKSIEIYEKLLKIYPTDADLYWSMLLCRYGVEYQPNGCALNRTQSRSLLADEDYKTALKYATSEQRSIMESQAAEIDRIRRAIVEAASGCKEYDVYLCCKEFDENGRRTKDAVVTTDLYKKLNGEGLRVFFTQITLEDTLTSEWEQHIYSALNSSKVMVVVSTDKEGFENIWVRNAWVRYLSLMSGEQKAVIPVFKNIDANELPAELSSFQALDMAKLGFESDLISSIRSIIDTEPLVQSTTNLTNSPLLRRAYVHLEDGEFSKANNICDQLLKTQGENAEVYLIKLLAQYQAKSEDKLDYIDADYSQSQNYRKAMSLGDEGFRIKLREHSNRSVYNKLILQLASSESEKQLRDVAEGFRVLGEYADSSEKAKLAESRIATLKEKNREDIYALCVKHLNESTDIDILKSVKKSLNKLGDYKDCANLIVKCDEKIKQLSEQKYNSIFTGEKSVKIKPILVALPISFVLYIVGFFVIFSFPFRNSVNHYSSTDISSTSADSKSAPLSNEEKYKEALSLLEYGKYDEAIAAFSALGDYSYSKEKILEAKYKKADELFSNGNYDEAELIFTALGDYSDCAERIIDCKREKGTLLLEKGELNKAEHIFSETNDSGKLNEVRYQKAILALENGDKTTAKELFNSLGDYSNAREKYCEIVYEEAEQLVKNGSFEQASKVLASISDYPDKSQLSNACTYHKAKQYANAKDYKNAIKLYEQLGDYSDSAAQLWNARYSYALNLIENKRYNEAYTLLDMLGNNTEIQKLKLKIADKTLYKGDTFIFGSYEQDGNTANGKEPIKWIVMGSAYDVSTKTSGIYLISEKVLDVKTFGSSAWDNSPLRSWLNNEFYNTAFSSFEKEYLYEYSYYPSSVGGGNNVRFLNPYYNKRYVDKVFVPQVSYIDFYMNNKVTEGKNISAPPTKAVQAKLNTSASKVEWWCVSEDNMYAYSAYDCDTFTKRTDDYNTPMGVRPVIVIVSK